MHESTFIGDLIDRIDKAAREHHCKKVTGVRVILGPLALISPDHFRVHFNAAACGTVAEGAQLDLEVLSDILDPGSTGVTLDSIEMEE